MQSRQAADREAFNEFTSAEKFLRKTELADFVDELETAKPEGKDSKLAAPSKTPAPAKAPATKTTPATASAKREPTADELGAFLDHVVAGGSSDAAKSGEPVAF